MAEETVRPWGETKIIGKPIPPVDGYERVSGMAVYPLDVILPNMLYGAILRCPHAHATVKKIDVGKAREMPGVRAVLTDADPEARAVGWYAAPRPPGPPVAGGPRLSRLFDPHCRYEGEEVAAVAAESPQEAWDAVRAIQVEYETQPCVTDMEEALKPGAPAVQEGGNRMGAPSETRRGDVEKGFAEADVVLEETYRNSCQLHSPLEVHGSVAQWDGDRLTVWDTNQGPFGIQAGIARAMNMPLSKVRVISHYMGGGFGSKQEAGKYTIIGALLAKKTARPVKLFLTREAEFLCVGNRPAHIMRLKAGVKKDGTLTALQLTAMGEVGAYPSSASVGMQAGELYKCPNVRIEETSVYINAGQARAFRAPGSPEGSWALEQMLDSLAERIGMDPVELRLKNITTVSQMSQNRPYTSTGLSESLTQGAQAFGWKEARGRPKGNGPLVRGVGVASGMFITGFAPATAILKLFPDGSANLNIGAADLGGTKTFAAMIVTEELGVPLDRIQIENADTGTTQYSSVSGGSKTAATDGVPVRMAALEIKGLLLEMAAQQLKVPVADLVFQDGAILARAGAQKLAITDLMQLRMQNGVVGVGRQRPIPADKVIRGFATEFAEVEVNTRTGEMRVLRMLAADDAGRVLSLLMYRNQVWGGMLQGLGLAVTEGRIMDSKSGKMVNANFHDYKIPTAKDVPGEMTCLPIDLHDTECNINGVKGLGEPCHVPAGAAIANAFYNATGIRVTAAPITAAQVLTLLAERKTRG